MLLPAPALALPTFIVLASLLPGAAQAAGVADTPMARCIAANRQTLADLDLALTAAQRRHVLSPVRVARLQGVATQLAKLRSARPPKTLADCEQATVAMAAEAERLQHLAAAGAAEAAPASAAVVDPPPAATTASASVAAERRACLAEQVKAFNELAQRFNGLTAPGRVRAEKQAELRALGARLSQLQQSLSAPLTEAMACAQAAAAVAQARSDLEQLAAGP